MDNLTVFEVKRIVAHKKKGQKIMYFVEWEGYGDEANTWEPEEHFEDFPNVLEEYWTEKGAKPKGKMVKNSGQKPKDKKNEQSSTIAVINCVICRQADFEVLLLGPVIKDVTEQYGAH